MPERTLHIDATFTTELDDYELARMCRDLDGACPTEEHAEFAGARPQCVLCAAIGHVIACREVRSKHWAAAFKKCRVAED